MKFHTRAIEKIKTVLENNCGPAGPAPAVAGPTPAPVTPAPTPAPPTTVTQTVRLKIETFDETSFKKAIAQLLNEAISQGSINVDSSSGFQVTADDITIVKASADPRTQHL